MAALPGLPTFLLPPLPPAAAVQAAQLQPTLLGFPGAAPLQSVDPQHARLLPPAAVQALQLGLPLPGGGGAAAGLPLLQQEQQPETGQQQQPQQHPHLQYTLEALAPHQTAAVVKAAQAAAAALAAGGGRDLLYVNPRQLAAIQRRREKRERQEHRMMQMVAKQRGSRPTKQVAGRIIASQRTRNHLGHFVSGAVLEAQHRRMVALAERADAPNAAGRAAAEGVQQEQEHAEAGNAQAAGEQQQQEQPAAQLAEAAGSAGEGRQQQGASPRPQRQVLSPQQPAAAEPEQQAGVPPAARQQQQQQLVTPGRPATRSQQPGPLSPQQLQLPQHQQQAQQTPRQQQARQQRQRQAQAQAQQQQQQQQQVQQEAQEREEEERAASQVQSPNGSQLQSLQSPHGSAQRRKRGKAHAQRAAPS